MSRPLPPNPYKKIRELRAIADAMEEVNKTLSRVFSTFGTPMPADIWERLDAVPGLPEITGLTAEEIRDIASDWEARIEAEQPAEEAEA